MPRTGFMILTLAGLALAACSRLPSTPDMFDKGIGSDNMMRFVLGGLALSTPPGNQIVIGPCNDEFAMPASRKASCDLHYKIRGKDSPWDQTAMAAQASSFSPADLNCYRTLGGVAECVPLNRVHPPLLRSPNMGTN